MESTDIPKNEKCLISLACKQQAPIQIIKIEN